jgi:molybdopterin molybdotransferase
MATFLLFVRPALLRLRGEALPLLPEYRATTVTPLKKAPGRKEYQRAVCEQDSEGHWRVSTTGNQGSHVLRSMSRANCFAVLPLEWGDVEPGNEITIIPFEGLL